MIQSKFRNPLKAILLIILCMSFNNGNAQYRILDKMDWWYQARFGMFIRFGSYYCLGHAEWAFFTEHWNKANCQAQVSVHFDPVDFNACTIAGLAQKAGTKYPVFTAKHHEGFAIWYKTV